MSADNMIVRLNAAARAIALCPSMDGAHGETCDSAIDRIAELEAERDRLRAQLVDRFTDGLATALSTSAKLANLPALREDKP